MRELTGTTNYNGKTFSVTMCVNDMGCGLWKYAHQNNLTDMQTKKAILTPKQIIGTCDFSAGKNDRNLKMMIKQAIITQIEDKFSIYDNSVSCRVQYK